RHLRRLGHRRIGLIGDPGASAPTIALEHLRAGTSQALREIGVTPRGTAVVRRDASFAGGIDAMATMLREPLPPTAVLAGSDEMAAGARWAAVEAGLEVPGDLSIVGFGGRDVALHAGLTTVAQPVTEMGETAATLLLAAMAGAEVTDTVLPCTLVVRHSSGRDRPPRGGGRSGRTGQAAASRLESGTVDGRP
ncbi:MAG TPA: substrate-binding domain-containing protein, partial [Euzebyales bacterium]|nr:substrate-binding domain-containing protein [Euzebyales bacterium]